MATNQDPRGIPADFDAADLRPPRRWSLVREGRVVLERLALRVSESRLRERAPRGNGETVLVVPGFATDDSWTKRLRRFLTDLDYRVEGWSLGRNNGQVPKLIPAVIDRAEQLAEERRASIRLVGWSLGGYLVRETARERPELVERVMTLGTPIVGGPSYTASAPLYVKKGYDLGEIAAGVLEREKSPITVPVYAVYSRSDGVVQWQSCIDTFRNPCVEHHEIDASHLGMVNSPKVFRLVAELLAERRRSV
jgi:dienelactone hydrolase